MMFMLRFCLCRLQCFYTPGSWHAQEYCKLFTRPLGEDRCSCWGFVCADRNSFLTRPHLVAGVHLLVDLSHALCNIPWLEYAEDMQHSAISWPLQLIGWQSIINCKMLTNCASSSINTAKGCTSAHYICIQSMHAM